MLAVDGRYDATDRLDITIADLYIPNDYGFEIVAQEPRLFLAASVNLSRRDALDELERVEVLFTPA